jgi:hypothetical protein
MIKKNHSMGISKEDWEVSSQVSDADVLTAKGANKQNKEVTLALSELMDPSEREKDREDEVEESDVHESTVLAKLSNGSFLFLFSVYDF